MSYFKQYACISISENKGHLAIQCLFVLIELQIAFTGFQSASLNCNFGLAEYKTVFVRHPNFYILLPGRLNVFADFVEKLNSRI